MGTVLYKIDECCGDIEFRIVDSFEIDEIEGHWYISKEEAINKHDSEFFINLELETIHCLTKKLKAVMLENKKLHNEILHLENLIDSAYISFHDEGLYT